jgi:hypothetical protein
VKHDDDGIDFHIEEDAVINHVWKTLSFSSGIVIPRHFIENAKFKAQLNQDLNAWVVSMNTSIWAQELAPLEQTIEFSTPKTWWDHFKASCLPQWAQRMFPPQIVRHTRSVIFRRYHAYPQVAGLHPMSGKPYVVKERFEVYQ